MGVNIPTMNLASFLFSGMNYWNKRHEHTHNISTTSRVNNIMGGVLTTPYSTTSVDGYIHQQRQL